MPRFRSRLLDALGGLDRRLSTLEQAAELIKTVLIVKEPASSHAAGAFEGLRKQVVAASGERRSHLSQLVSMAVAVDRARTVDDLRPQVAEWLHHAGVVQVWTLQGGVPVHELFEDVGGAGLGSGDHLEVVEPAYVDQGSGSLLRLGRARRVPAVEDEIEPAPPALPAAGRHA